MNIKQFLDQFIKRTPGYWFCDKSNEIKGNPGEQDFVEYKMTGKGPVMLYKVVKDSPHITIGHDRWVQFSPEGWEEMQAVNGKLMAAPPVFLETIEKLCKALENVGESYLVESILRDASDKINSEYTPTWPSGSQYPSHPTYNLKKQHE